MPPRISTILERLRQDRAAVWSRHSIEEACRGENYTWRQRLLDPPITIDLVLLQILHGNTACQHVVPFGPWSFTQRASCQARARIPLAIFHRLLERVAAVFRVGTAGDSRWFGHRAWRVDGSSFAMPDTPELQRHFGPPGGQRQGCGSPVAMWLALVDLTTGMLLRTAPAPLRTHDLSRAPALSRALEPGDLVLGDRGFCSSAHRALLTPRQVHGVFRIPQRQLVDFTPGRPHARRGSKDRPGMPHARWVRAQGQTDQIVVWSQPKRQPSWLTAEESAAWPEELTVRELRYRVAAPGYRVRAIALVTTRLDAATDPASALADLYYRRWQVEINFKHIKTTMKMDVVRCETVAGVLQELAVFALASNLVRSVLVESVRVQGVEPSRISLVDALRWLTGVEGGEGLSVLVVNPERPGRVEPRVVNRRPKQYTRMTKPRSELRKLLPKKGL